MSKCNAGAKVVGGISGVIAAAGMGVMLACGLSYNNHGINPDSFPGGVIPSPLLDPDLNFSTAAATTAGPVNNTVFYEVCNSAWGILGPALGFIVGGTICGLSCSKPALFSCGGSDQQESVSADRYQKM